MWMSILQDLICHYQFLVAFASQGWCGEVRDIIFSDNGNVTVVYRVTIRGLDGEVLVCNSFISCLFSFSINYTMDYL